MKRATLVRALQAGAGLTAESRSPIARSALAEPPLSFGQQRLWFLERLMADNTDSNVSFAARLRGPLQIPLWCSCLQQIVRRHNILRTRFPEDRPVQIVEPVLELEQPIVDLGGLVEPLRTAELDRLARGSARQRFHLARLPLLRSTLVRLGPEDHCQLLTLHHIVCDGWSDEILLREMSILYHAAVRGGAAPLPELPIQYADFAVWQREHLQGEVLERQLAYWKQKMAGAPALLSLPIDRPRPASPSYRAGFQAFAVDVTTTAALQQISRNGAATLFMALLAAFKLLLVRATGQTDLVVGSPVANRSRPETESLIGFFVNTLPLRTDLSGDPSFREALRRVRETSLGGIAHQDLPFERLVDELQPDRTLSHAPIFQVMFLFLASGRGASREAVAELGLAVETLEVDSGSSVFDLSLALGDLAGSLAFRRDLFESITAIRLVRHFCTLLEEIATAPDLPLSRLSLLAPEERFQVLTEWNDTAQDLPFAGEPLLHEGIAAQIERTPEAEAVACEGSRLSYRELGQQADVVAGLLSAHGVGVGGIVGVLMERSLELMPALLGILRVGAAYLPLDPEWPSERLAFLLEDAGISTVLTSPETVAGLPSRTGVEALVLGPEILAWSPASARRTAFQPPESLAYVLYTSGSTGAPKGAMISHAGICNRLLWMQHAYRLGLGDRVLQKTPLTFDVSVWELFWPLLTGATLVLARPGGHRDPAYLVAVIRDERITTLHFVPSLLQVFLEAPDVETCRSLRRVVSSGEALPRELVASFHERLGISLENLYGPTEASVDVTAWTCCPGEPDVPIGRPIANVRIHLLDSRQSLVPIGVAGELHIAGVALARGYLGRPALTAERFVPNPFAAQQGERLYRTGDLARWCRNGTLEYLGRIDHQVKIRGFRIELGEIEAALLCHTGVQETVVAAVGGMSERRLVAYLVLTPGQAPDLEGLRRALLERLPAFMVPAFYVVLEELPRITSGKVDRRRLPAPDPERHAMRREYLAPSTPVEAALAETWSAVLGLARVSRDDNFFALGGDSMNSLQVVSRAQERGLPLSLPEMFRYPSLRELAAAVTAAVVTAANGPGSLVEEPGDNLLVELLAELEGLSEEETQHLIQRKLGALMEEPRS